MNAILVRARMMTNALLVTAVVDFGLAGGRDAPAGHAPELLRLGRNLLRGSRLSAPQASPPRVPERGADHVDESRPGFRGTVRGFFTGR